jgi:hypothetical protein
LLVCLKAGRDGDLREQSSNIEDHRFASMRAKHFHFRSRVEPEFAILGCDAEIRATGFIWTDLQSGGIAFKRTGARTQNVCLE